MISMFDIRFWEFFQKSKKIPIPHKKLSQRVDEALNEIANQKRRKAAKEKSRFSILLYGRGEVLSVEQNGRKRAEREKSGGYTAYGWQKERSGWCW